MVDGSASAPPHHPFPAKTVLVWLRYGAVAVYISNKDVLPSRAGCVFCLIGSSVRRSPSPFYYYYVLFGKAPSRRRPRFVFPLRPPAWRSCCQFDHWLSLTDHRGGRTTRTRSQIIYYVVFVVFLYILIILTKIKKSWKLDVLVLFWII